MKTTGVLVKYRERLTGEEIFAPKSGENRRKFLIAALKGLPIRTVTANHSYRVEIKAYSPKEIAEAMMAFAQSGMTRTKYVRVVTGKSQERA